jgi:alkaline phosphatase
MTLKALKILENSENGYFLFVEGGRIDHGHHDQQAHKALEEFVELDDTIEEVLKRINLDETLVIVTADHSHSMQFIGYDARNTSVFDNVEVENSNKNNYFLTDTFIEKTTDSYVDKFFDIPHRKSDRIDKVKKTRIRNFNSER